MSFYLVLAMYPAQMSVRKKQMLSPLFNIYHKIYLKATFRRLFLHIMPLKITYVCKKDQQKEHELRFFGQEVRFFRLVLLFAGQSAYFCL